MEKFEVIVIGGGISGLGVALEASRRGLSTLIIEKGSVASATSNNTLRIIHGGFRYLQHGDLPRVIQSLRDQRDLMREMPDIVHPLPCLMPLSRWGFKSKVPVTVAAATYGAMMKLSGAQLGIPRVVSSTFIDSTVPLLRGRAPHGALCWYDAVMSDPPQIAKRLVEKIAAHNGTVVEQTAVAAVRRLSADAFEVNAINGTSWESRVVINTLGPWLGNIDTPQELAGPRPQWCKGFNLVIARQLESEYGVSAASADGRLFFCVPRGSGTSIGTWYVPHEAGVDAPVVSEEEISTFLGAFNEAMPAALVRRDEVVGTDVGILPMKSLSLAGPTLQAHETITNRSNYIEVVSTKYTTFRSLGRKVMDVVTR